MFPSDILLFPDLNSYADSEISADCPLPFIFVRKNFLLRNLKAKLTLSIDKETIEKGRKLARKEHHSLSAMVENLLNAEIEKDTRQKKTLISELYGIAGSVSEETSWKEVVRDAANEKYGK